MDQLQSKQNNKTRTHDKAKLSNDREQSIRQNILQLFKDAPIPEDEVLTHISLFIRRFRRASY